MVAQLASQEDHTLIDKFREREENVKIEVFNTFLLLLDNSYVSGSECVIVVPNSFLLAYQCFLDYA